MEIIYYDNKTKWNNFLTSQKLSSFLQSWEWGEWQEKLGKKVYRLTVVENEEILATCQIIQNFIGPKLLRKNYFYIPRGPVVESSLENKKKKAINNLIFEKINELAKKEKAFFLRTEPLEKTFLENFKTLKKTKNIQPADTWVLDLAQTEEELLAQMHSKARYNIKLAERKGVTIQIAENTEDIESFFKVLDSTSRRNEFGIYSLKYYQELFELLSENTTMDNVSPPVARVYLAKFENQVIAAIWVIFFGDTATYLYGGMDKKHSKLMAPHLIQWQAIMEAKKRDCKYYDFWGIAPDGADKKHAWFGLTRFKKQFGGLEINYPGSNDAIFQKMWYYIYNKLKKII